MCKDVLIVSFKHPGICLSGLRNPMKNIGIASHLYGFEPGTSVSSQRMKVKSAVRCEVYEIR
jgi:hypothetical protein